MEIKFYNVGKIPNDQFNFAVISASYKGRWIFVRHKDRDTWEMPAGRREDGEDISLTASRELFEETGAVNYKIESIHDYSVTIGETTTYGRLFFAEVQELSPLPDSEICEIKLLKEMPENLTYKQIQQELQGKILLHLKNKTLDMLVKDRIRNINMINFIKNYPVYSFDFAGGSSLIRGRSDEEWVYISSESFAEYQELVKGLDKDDKCYAVLEDWMLSDIVKDREISSRMTCIKLVYDEKASLQSPEITNTISLSTNDAQYIYDNSKYKEYTSIEYIEDRIKNGIGLGIYKDGKWVAWAITHDDGAIGFLNVLDEYRRQGYGMEVTNAIVKRVLDLSDVPFVHIEEENIESLNLALKVGFYKDRRVHWYKFI